MKRDEPTHSIQLDKTDCMVARTDDNAKECCLPQSIIIFILHQNPPSKSGLHDSQLCSIKLIGRLHAVDNIHEINEGQQRKDYESRQLMTMTSAACRVQGI